MQLHTLLNDRTAVCALKKVYDHEVIEKSSYTTKQSFIEESIGMTNISDSLANLEKFGLVSSEKVEGELILSITEKGRHFIEIFDQLVELFSSKPVKIVSQSVKVKYELTDLEKKILVFASKISKESGKEFILLRTLTQEIYPYQQVSRKISTISRYVKQLEQLNLLERKKKGRETIIKVTDNGDRIIKQQYLKEIL
ncbi:hypothetical protein ACFL0W_04355 [Nanoarchaeota archaeon]